MFYCECFFGDFLQLQFGAILQVLSALDEVLGDCAMNDGFGVVAETIHSEIFASFGSFVVLQFNHNS